MSNSTSPAQSAGLWDTHVPNKSIALVLISIVLTLVTTAFFVFRQAWRWINGQRGWDDLLATGGYVNLVIITILGCVSGGYGFGKHASDLSRPDLVNAMFYFYLYQIGYKMLGGFTKLTFCLLYLRLFGHDRRIRYFLWTVMVIVGLGSLVMVFPTIWQCKPVRRAWDKSVPGTCVNNMIFWYFHATWNILWDIVVRTCAQVQRLGLLLTPLK
jgi:hypothetical protein